MITGWKYLGLISAGLGTAGIGLSLLPTLWTWAQREFLVRLDDYEAQARDFFIPWDRAHLALGWFTAWVGIPGLVFFYTGKAWAAACLLFLLFPTPRWVLGWVRRHRSKGLHDQLGDVLTALSNGMRSGLSLQASLRMVVEEMPSPAREEFALVLKAHEMGEPLETSLERLLNRVPSDELNMFVTSVHILRKAGGDLPTQFDMVVKTIQRRQRVEGRIKTLTAQGRFQTIAIALVGVGLSLSLWVVSPDMMRPLLNTTPGRLCFAVSTTLFTLGVLAMRKMARVEV